MKFNKYITGTLVALGAAGPAMGHHEQTLSSAAANLSPMEVVLVVLVTLTSLNGFSKRNKTSNKAGDNTPVLTAGCASAVAKATLELNNVRTRIFQIYT